MSRLYSAFLVVVITTCELLMLNRELGLAILSLVAFSEIVNYRKKA